MLPVPAQAAAEVAQPTALDRVDKYLSYEVAKFTQNHAWFEGLVTYTGLVPYELYVLPGMALAIMYAVFHNHPASLRFHVLPHVFAFSFVGLIKTMVRRPRPGCYNLKEYGDMVGPGNFEQHKKCKRDYTQGHKLPAPWSKRGGFAYVSFPSGHATVACAVMTGLLLYLSDTAETKWTGPEVRGVAEQMAGAIALFALVLGVVYMLRPNAELQSRRRATLIVLAIFVAMFYFLSISSINIDMNDFGPRMTVMCMGLYVAMMVSVHRVAKGYHHVFDSILGALLGFCIGSTVYTMWPKATQLTEHVNNLVNASSGTSRATIGVLAFLYLSFFFSTELECLDGCNVAALAKAEH